MFERFTEPARQVIVLGQDDARRLGHNYIGTEHLLLGLLREEQGLAARVLRSLGVTLEDVRSEVERIVGQGDDVSSGQIPFTPRAKKVLELGSQEATKMGHAYIGTEHILLGLVVEGEGVANRILDDLGATGERLRAALEEMFGGEVPPSTGSIDAVSWTSIGLPRPSLLDRIGVPAALVIGAALFGVGLLVGRVIWG